MTSTDRKSLSAIILLLTSLWLPVSASSEESAANLVLVTLDGVRWQEVFGGADLSLIEDERYSHNPDLLKKAYWHEQRNVRRERLFPFLWSVIAADGAFVGDRERGSQMEVSNNWWFSYPGYNEILTGRADPSIDSNDRNWNANVTFLEALNGRSPFTGRVLAFASWDVFPYVINTQRSHVPVNIGPSDSAPAPDESTQTGWLNEVSSTAPRLWPTVRLDFLTHGYAMEALREQHPRVLYVAYGETDDFAHDGNYDRYLDAAHRTDQMLAELWRHLQSDAFYRGRTNFLITTDHGRGNSADGWPHHASPAAIARGGIKDAADGVPGSNQTWLTAIGPAIRSAGLIKGQWKQSQIAATALATLQLNPEEVMPDTDKAMEQLLRTR